MPILRSKYLKKKKNTYVKYEYNKNGYISQFFVEHSVYW